MRRPSRSIEVFDISLMAVVTKAMGAFLVLMLVFMQYYSSGPIGQKTTADILQAIDDTEKNLSEAAKKIAEHASPEEIANLLEDARRHLLEARQEIEQLKRENDALNSQVQRLEGENAALQKQVESQQRKIDAGKTIISGDLIGWDCLDTHLELSIVQQGMTVELEGGIKDPYILNFRSLGDSDTVDDASILEANPQAANFTPGEHYRFNNSSFRFAADPGLYSLVVNKKKLNVQKVKGYVARALKQSKKDCTILLSLQTTTPAKDKMLNQLTRRLTLPKEDYTTALFDVKLDGTDITLQDVSADNAKWLADQVVHAAKD